MSFHMLDVQIPATLDTLNAALSKPFGEVDIELRAQVFALHQLGHVNVFVDGQVTMGPSWYPDTTYQVEAAAPKADSIDWSHVAPRYRWMARDESGDIYLYSVKPTLHTCDVEWSTAAKYLSAHALASVKRGTVSWKDSLVERT